MALIMAPVEVDICFDGYEPDADDAMTARVARQGGAPAMIRRRGHEDIGPVREARARAAGAHPWAGSFRGTRGPVGPENASVVHRLEAMRDAGMITNQQCVALATAAVGIRLGGHGEGAWTGDWRRGESAETGGLVSGTPVATFLNRRGETGQAYAIGGNGGQPGAHLDHAAVFQAYIRDKAGKIEGMNVSEQYAGSGGAHSRAYYFHEGWGEGNASNYYAIDVKSGGHLGGAANPLTRKQYSDAAMKAATESTPSLGTQ